MNRPRKKKESSLLNELKELELLEEGELVDIPELENEDLIEENSKSIIVRCLNPIVHKVGGLVKALPPIWGLEDGVSGRGVGESRVQFFFQHERDLHFVLTKGPWFVNGWIVSMEQWSPYPGPDFLCKIPFWIRVRGIPVHLLKKQAVEGLLGPLGRVEKVELHAKNSSSVEYIRALVWINTEEPLQFRRIARFKSGEIAPTELEYEKLIKEGLAVDHSKYRDAAKQKAGSSSHPGPISQGKEGVGRRSDKPQKTKEGRRSRTTQSSRKTSDLMGRGGGARKDKQAPGASSQVWLPKTDQSLPVKTVGGSRSTEESSAFPKSRSPSLGRPGVGTSSGASQDAASVFNRLGAPVDSSPHSNQCLLNQREEVTPATSVFERLSGLEPSPPAETRFGDADPSGIKRRRLSRSDERSSKKPKLGASPIESTPSKLG
ncbi:Uncharacterized protein Rs2_25402 [Raphanus sativus]|nr:Uncharacterized protein Rs2_25402 [Raphanus sativus]